MERSFKNADGSEETLMISSNDGLELSLNGNYKLKRNTEMIFGFNIDYLYLNDVKADGDFLVNFDPIKLEFGLTPASYYEATGINEDA